MADESYARSRTCACPRCRANWYMGPAVLVTLGVLFLLSEFSVARFERTWPILLIVIGLVKVLQWSSPLTGHSSGALLPSSGEASDESKVPHV
jgi:hypothetical protein